MTMQNKNNGMGFREKQTLKNKNIKTQPKDCLLCTSRRLKTKQPWWWRRNLYLLWSCSDEHCCYLTAEQLQVMLKPLWYKTWKDKPLHEERRTWRGEGPLLTLLSTSICNITQHTHTPWMVQLDCSRMNQSWKLYYLFYVPPHVNGVF